MSAQNEAAFKVISYNMQVAIGSHRLHHMLSHGLRYLFPHGQSLLNLRRIAELVADVDIVGLNEADAGSLRTGYLNQAEHISMLDAYVSCEQMITRDLGRVAQHSNSLLSRHAACKVVRHRLPKPNDGRGVLEVHYMVGGRKLVVLVTHLSLVQRVRAAQLDYLADVVAQFESVVLMGDMNCSLQSAEMVRLLDNASLHGSPSHLTTFPSWRPRRAIDHILLSDNLSFVNYAVKSERLSDHLAVCAEVAWRK